MPRTVITKGFFSGRIKVVYDDNDRAIKRLGKYLKIDLMNRKSPVVEVVIKNELLCRTEFFYKHMHFAIEFRNHIFVMKCNVNGENQMIGIIPNSCTWREKAYILRSIIKAHEKQS